MHLGSTFPYRLNSTGTQKCESRLCSLARVSRTDTRRPSRPRALRTASTSRLDLDLRARHSQRHADSAPAADAWSRATRRVACAAAAGPIVVAPLETRSDSWTP